jgi:hypothetical protein
LNKLDGILGLGPNQKKLNGNSLIMALKNSGLIDQGLVSFSLSDFRKPE